MTSDRQAVRSVIGVRALIALLLVLGAAAAPASAARRVTVAVVGDSIVESGHLADPDRAGLVPALRAALAARGVDVGGDGFVAAHRAQLEPIAAPRLAHGDRWSYRGAWTWLTRWRPDAPVGLASWSADAGARATLTARADSATLVYLQGPAEGSFTFRVGPRRVRIDARRATSGAALRKLEPPPGPQAISVSAPADGGMGLVGVFLRRQPRPGAVQVEVSAIAHAGARAGEPEPGFETAGLASLAPRLTVLVLGTNDGIAYARSGDPADLEALRDGLLARARRARATGACLVVPPGPDRFPPAVFAAVRAAVDAAARAAGCPQAPLLDGLEADPALTFDAIHPTAAGYARIADPLAARVLALVGLRRGA